MNSASTSNSPIVFYRHEPFGTGACFSVMPLFAYPPAIRRFAPHPLVILLIGLLCALSGRAQTPIEEQAGDFRGLIHAALARGEQRVVIPPGRFTVTSIRALPAARYFRLSSGDDDPAEGVLPRKKVGFGNHGNGDLLGEVRLVTAPAMIVGHVDPPVVAPVGPGSEGDAGI